jgi:hypothetical protein
MRCHLAGAGGVSGSLIVFAQATISHLDVFDAFFTKSLEVHFPTLNSYGTVGSIGRTRSRNFVLGGGSVA